MRDKKADRHLAKVRRQYKKISSKARGEAIDLPDARDASEATKGPGAIPWEEIKEELEQKREKRPFEDESQ